MPHYSQTELGNLIRDSGEASEGSRAGRSQPHGRAGVLAVATNPVWWRDSNSDRMVL